MMTSKISVLFLCTGNSARSQMAEALLRHHAGDSFEAFSAGLEPKGIHPLTAHVMHEIGLDLRGQRSKDVREYMGKQHFGYLITVCANADSRCPTTFPGVGQRLRWEFDDPAAVVGTDAERLEKFRQVRDQIDARIRAWLDEQGITVKGQVESRQESSRSGFLEGQRLDKVLEKESDTSVVPGPVLE